MVELGTADYQSSFVAVVKSGNLIITIICIKEVLSIGTARRILRLEY